MQRRPGPRIHSDSSCSLIYLPAELNVSARVTFQIGVRVTYCDEEESGISYAESNLDLMT